MYITLLVTICVRNPARQLIVATHFDNEVCTNILKFGFEVTLDLRQFIFIIWLWDDLNLGDLRHYITQTFRFHTDRLDLITFGHEVILDLTLLALIFRPHANLST